MPADIGIIHAHDFIKANPEGKLDLEESKKLLVEVAAVAVDLKPWAINMKRSNALS